MKLGWSEAPVSALLEYTIGGAWGKAPGEDEVDVTVIRVADFRDDGTADPASAPTRSVTRKQFEAREMRRGDLLLEKSGGGPTKPVGRVVRVRPGGSAVIPTNFVQLLRAGGAVNSSYLFWWLWWSHLNGSSDAFQRATTNIRNLRTTDYLDRPMPLPPLAEQQRIVAAIEEHLSRLQAADANLASGRRRIQKLRDAVHDSLVDPDWPLRPLGELLREPLRNGVSAKASSAGNTRIITLTAVTTGEFSERNSKVADVDSSRTNGLWLEPGDVLIERSNTPELVGTAALFDGPCEWAIFPDLLIRVRPSAELLPEYLNLVLSTPRVRRYFQRTAQGISGSMPKIDQGAVLRLAVPTPPIDEQVRAVERATAALAGCKRLEAATLVSKRQVASLRRSILARAFRGELVPQDTRDEPASVLLERITAERAASPTKKTRARQVRTPA